MVQYENGIEKIRESSTVAKEEAEYVEIKEMASRMEEGSENSEMLFADISHTQSGEFQTIKSVVKATVCRPCFPMIASR